MGRPGPIWTDLAPLIGDVQYVIDAGDAVLDLGLKGSLKRACAIGRRRPNLEDVTLNAYEADLGRRLDRSLALDPTHPAGIRLRRMTRKLRSNLSFVVLSIKLEPPL